jgi:hypothetical protein
MPATHDLLPVLAAVARDEDPARPLPWRGAHLVHRSEGRLTTERIDADEAAVLAALVAGRDFASACDAASAEDGAERVAAGARALVAACARGLVVRLELAAER